MKKKTILNICMVLTIVVIAVCGVMAVGSVKGWFGSADSDVTAAEKSGIVMVERNGVAYELSQGAGIREGDRLYTKTAAALTLAKKEEEKVFLGANADLKVTEAGKNFQMEVLKGEALIDARGMDGVTVISDNTEITMNQAVATISTQAGSSMVYVYSGEVSVKNETIFFEDTVAAGNVATIVSTGKYDLAAISANSLSAVQMAQMKTCGMDETFCFTEEELDKVQAEREAEILKAQQEVIKQKEEAKKAATEAAKKKESDAKNEASSNVNTTSFTENTEGSTETLTDEIVTDETISENDSLDDTEYAEDEDFWEEETEETSMSCTIKIVCDTILDNMENLTPGKEGYVPSSGTIIGTTSVDFYEGETVFDVLQRVCDSAGIQLEYSWTPMYDSYYIEGINHLYEFDCGNESGWMYKVNGWFPNYGCSSYTLQDQDTIVWCYTCNGLGADVGGGSF